MRERYQQLASEIHEDYLRSSDSDSKSRDEAVKDEGDLSVDDMLTDFTAQRMDHCALEMRALQSALDRIEEGTYGQCEECSENIDPRRLEAQPTSRLCIACANRRERDRVHTFPRL